MVSLAGILEDFARGSPRISPARPVGFGIAIGIPKNDRFLRVTLRGDRADHPDQLVVSAVLTAVGKLFHIIPQSSALSETIRVNHVNFR
jgi:hypothetical protein